MDDEIRHIIAHMAGIELAMLEDRGLFLPQALHQKAGDYRALAAAETDEAKRDRALASSAKYRKWRVNDRRRKNDGMARRRTAA